MITHPILKGSIVALPTPFTTRADGSDGGIDYRAVDYLIERQIESGSDGLVLGGSTGEATSMSEREREMLFAFAVGAARGRIPVIAGVGSSDTRVACRLAVAAERAGAAALLATTPAYSRPTQEGLRLHFAAIANASRLPIALYNIPGRTGVDLLPETVSKIAGEHANVVAIKEASDSLERIRVLIELDQVAVLCGDDRWIADAIALGASGAVGVVSNLVPGRVSQLVQALARDPDHSAAPAIVESLAPLIRVLGIESNPGPLKCALELMGIVSGALRLPLASVSPENRERIREALERNGLSG